MMGASRQVDLEQHLAFAKAFLWPAVRRQIDRVGPVAPGMRALDIGCRAGATSDFLRQMGFDVVGVDADSEYIARARTAYPACRFEVARHDEDLAGRLGSFDLVTSLEFIEHVYDPVSFAQGLFGLLKPGAVVVVSTPYHGYLKNLLLAATGKLDEHFTALWVGGRIKFWSVATLTTLLTEAGFEGLRFERLGRIPPVANSMLVSAKKPA